MQRTFGELVGLPPTVPVAPDLTICHDCQADATHTVDHAAYCEACYDANYTECDSCHDAISRHDAMENANGDSYCDSCYSDAYTSCCECGREVAIDSDDEVCHDGDTYCRPCYERLFTCCDDCSECVPTDDAYTVVQVTSYGRRFTRSVCEGCYSDNYFTCEGCSESFHTDHIREHGDYLYCEACCPTDEDESEDCYAGCRCSYCQPTTATTYSRTVSQRRYGVELETANCDGWHSVPLRHFRQTADGSITGEEFVSSILSGDAGLADIEHFCQQANDAKWSVDSACGFHAHFDMRDLEAEQLQRVAYAYWLTHKVWTKFVSSSRADNQYCGENDWSFATIRTLTTIDKWVSFANEVDRYQWLNLAAYSEHKTFEIRLHSGTLNATKVCNWIIAHTRFIDAVASMSIEAIEAAFSGDAQDCFESMAIIWNDAPLADYYVQRAAKFGRTINAPIAQGV